MKVIALFALAIFVNADGQDKEPDNHSAELIDQTKIQYCMFNDFENKETQEVDLEFEGFGKPKVVLQIQPQGSPIYCGNTVMAKVELAEDIEIIDQYFKENKDKKKSIPIFSTKIKNLNDESKKVIAKQRERLSQQSETLFLLLDNNSDGRLTQSERVAAAAFT